MSFEFLSFSSSIQVPSNAKLPNTKSKTKESMLKNTKQNSSKVVKKKSAVKKEATTSSSKTPTFIGLGSTHSLSKLLEKLEAAIRVFAKEDYSVTGESTPTSRESSSESRIAKDASIQLNLTCLLPPIAPAPSLNQMSYIKSSTSLFESMEYLSIEEEQEIELQLTNESCYVAKTNSDTSLLQSSSKECYRSLHEISRNLKREQYLSSESPIQRILFSGTSNQSPNNIQTLVKCLKNAIPLFQVIRTDKQTTRGNSREASKEILNPALSYSKNPLLQILLFVTSSSTAESSCGNIANLTKKGICPMMLKWMASLLDLNADHLNEDLIIDILMLLVRAGKQEPKLPVQSRLHSAVKPVAEFLKNIHLADKCISTDRSSSKQDLCTNSWDKLMIGFQYIKLVCKSGLNAFLKARKQYKPLIEIRVP